MGDSHNGIVADDNTLSVGGRSNAGPVYYTPPLSPSLHEYMYPWHAGGGIQRQSGDVGGMCQNLMPGVPWYNMPRSRDGHELHCEQTPVSNNQPQGQPSDNDNDDDDDSTYDDALSNMSASWNEAIDQVSRHLGAQFDLPGSDYEKTDEVDFNARAPAEISFLDSKNTLESNTFRDPPTIPGPQCLPSFDYQRPSIVVSDPTGRTTAPVADDFCGLLLRDISLGPLDLVKQVRDNLHELNKAWMRKLASTPDLYIYCQQLSSCSLFETGIRTLQRCFLGTLPRTFKDIFALMHVAFAFSRVMNKDGGSYYWDGFCSDVRRWHHTMIGSEIALFARVWDRLWCPQPSAQLTTAMNGPSLINEFSPSPFASLDAVDPPLNTSTSVSINKSTKNSTLSSHQSDLYSILMEGMVIKGCSSLLDVVGYAAMVQRHSKGYAIQARCDSSVMEALEYKVTRPLTHCRAIKESWVHVINTQSKLRNGFVRNMHELELMLISHKTGPRISRSVHSRFVDQVTFQFDTIMGFPSPDWRYGYHTTNLELVLSIAIDLDEQRVKSRISPQEPPSISPAARDSGTLSSNPITNAFFGPSVRTTPSMQYQSFTNVPEPNINPTGLGSSYHTASSSSFASLMDAPPNLSNSLGTSIDSVPTHSTSRTRSISVGSSETTGSETRCNLCPDKKFTGSYTSRQRSLRRHKEAKHGLELKTPCPIPGCSSTFSRGRPDNVRRHVEKFHLGSPAALGDTT